ncbi:choline/ethanolamine kinase family protein [Jatrophihabitans sp.]|uniref:choline/ethanolamine kinase family protein n=1 Tax=Jatrophihabitans sp. TaxID=1932789 RepID=UPI0030C6F3F7
MTAERPLAVGAGAAAVTPSARVAADRARLESASPLLPAITLPLQEFEPLPGGLTNRNYRIVAADSTVAVARISSDSSAQLAIDRDAEFRNACIAAESGVAPQVLGYAVGLGISVVEWIDGRTFEPADLDDSETLVRLAAACRRLHASEPFVTDFDMFEILHRYLDIVQRNGYRIPASYTEYLPLAARIEAALAVHPEPVVPCHNDLLAANLMSEDLPDGGQQLWLIDYEYAGNNDPCFELGNIASESHLSVDRLDELVAAYFGAPSRARSARARLYALMSNYGWTLWAAIQDSVSDVDFDFWAWGLEKYDRAEAAFASADLSELINDVQQLNESPRGS